MQQSRKYLHSVVKWVRSRTVWSTPSATLIQQQRIPRLQSPVSVIQIWQKRWLSTPRTTFLHRQVSLCLHRRTSLHRVYSLYYSNLWKNGNYYMQCKDVLGRYAPGHFLCTLYILTSKFLYKITFLFAKCKI